jgi:hypothetical protein
MLTAPANQSALVNGIPVQPVLDMAPAGSAVVPAIDLTLADSFNQLLSGLLGGEVQDVAAPPAEVFPLFMEMRPATPLAPLATGMIPTEQVEAGIQNRQIPVPTTVPPAPLAAQTSVRSVPIDEESAHLPIPTGLTVQAADPVLADIRELLTRLRLDPAIPLAPDLAIPIPDQPTAVPARNLPAPAVVQMPDDVVMAAIRDLVNPANVVNAPVLSTQTVPVRLAVQDKDITLSAERSPVSVLNERQPVHASSIASTIDVPVDSSEWKQVLSERVVWLSGQKHGSAEIHLNPPRLGPIQVNISMDQNQATVEFMSQHHAVRHALTDAVPLLREMLNQGGIQLLDVNVGDPTGQGQPHHRPGQDLAVLPAYPMMLQDPDASDDSPVSIRRPGLVDYYA